MKYQRTKGAIASIVSLLGLLFLRYGASAQEDIFLEVVIPGSRIEATTEGAVKTVVTGITEYVDVIFTFSISIVGLVAGVMIMIGGYQYLTSAGDAARAKQAKERIGNAVIGMVLALFSFVLLNQINPDLVKLKSVEQLIKPVKTELALLPWCEDILADGQLVTAVSKGKKCGDVGEYAPKEGSEKQFCLYHGGSLFSTSFNPKTGEDRRPDDDLRHSTVCMQGNRGGPEMVEIVKQLKDGKKLNKSKVALATEMSCLSISGETNDAGSLRALGFSGPTPELCERWTSIARSVYEKEAKPKRAAYCGWSSDRDRCIEVTINCEAANKNWDAGLPASCIGSCSGVDCLASSIGTGGDLKQCKEDLEAGAGCEGYDDSPEPIWRCHPSKDSSKYKKDEYKTCGFETLERTEKHLAGVCILNPCKFNLENGGCKGAGIGIHVYPPGVSVSTKDCRNR